MLTSFESSFFEEEVICDFKVQKSMKHYWASAIEVLAQFDLFCTENNIKYFVYYGTLLGAIRHKGFIPWDDDIDIVMPRKDYARLLNIAKKGLPNGLELINEYKVDKPTRVINSLCVTTNLDFLNKYHNCPYMVGIDIFVLDNIGNNKEDIEMIKAIWNAGSALARDISRMEKQSLDIPEEHLECIKMFENVIGKDLPKDYSVVKEIAYYLDMLQASLYDEESDNCTVMSYYFQDDLNEPTVPNEWLANTIRVPFENIMVPVPEKYDEILKKYYGDYMKPVMERTFHEYPCYLPSVKALRNRYEELGMKMPEEFDFIE